MTRTATTSGTTSATNSISKSMLGLSLLGTWTAQTELRNHETGDAISAEFVVHFMADPRRTHGCSLEECLEIDNNVCMIPESDTNGHHNKQCRDIAKETNVNWSDVVAFFNFGLHIHATSTKPKVPRMDLTTGDWVGPFNMILAADKQNASCHNHQRHTARYVMSQSITPPYFQNQIPPHNSLYTLQDVYNTVLGTPALSHMVQAQANTSFQDDHDPYDPFLQTCDHGSIQPLLPQWEWELVASNPNATCPCDEEDLQLRVKFRYKLMVIPHPSELAYRILPQLQPIFQAKGSDGYNRLSGPYCYDNDPFRAYSLDFQWDASDDHPQTKGQHMALVKGCVEGLPCLPPAAMGSDSSNSNNTAAHFNQSCFVDPYSAADDVDVGRLLLMFGCYGLGIALLMSLTFNCHLSYRQKRIMKKARQREEQLLLTDQWEFVGKRRRRSTSRDNLLDEEYPINSPPSPYFGKMSLLNGGGLASITNHASQDETVGPFGDLEHSTKDLLSQPLLEHQDAPQQQKNSTTTRRENKETSAL